jgi:kinesin family member 11
MKNGIYMSEDSYQEIHAQNISRGQLIEEHERKIEAMEIQLKSSRDQIEHQLKTLLDTKKDLERVGVCSSSRLLMTENPGRNKRTSR